MKKKLQLNISIHPTQTNNWQIKAILNLIKKTTIQYQKNIIMHLQISFGIK